MFKGNIQRLKWKTLMVNRSPVLETVTWTPNAKSANSPLKLHLLFLLFGIWGDDLTNRRRLVKPISSLFYQNHAPLLLQTASQFSKGTGNLDFLKALVLASSSGFFVNFKSGSGFTQMVLNKYFWYCLGVLISITGVKGCSRDPGVMIVYDCNCLYRYFTL